jgi:hypothetical protein
VKSRECERRERDIYNKKKNNKKILIFTKKVSYSI